jgi:hypothetical protein
MCVLLLLLYKHILIIQILLKMCSMNVDMLVIRLMFERQI